MKKYVCISNDDSIEYVEVSELENGSVHALSYTPYSQSTHAVTVTVDTGLDAKIRSTVMGKTSTIVVPLYVLSQLASIVKVLDHTNRMFGTTTIFGPGESI
jgi:hypothetical protein